MKRLLSLVVLGALVVASCSAGNSDAFSVDAITVTVGGTPSGDPGPDGVVPTEGGEEITIPGVEASQDSVDSQLEDIADSDEFVEFVESTGGSVRKDGGLDPEYVAQYLSDRIVFAIIGSEAERRGLEITDADREEGQAQLESRLGPEEAQPAGEDGTPAAPSGAQVLEFMPESYRDFLVDSFASVSALQAALNEESGPSDEEIQAVYDEDPTQFEQACGAHILIAANEDPAAGEIVSAEQAEGGAQLIINSLEAGADFAELAIEQSDDPGSGAQGGDLGCAGRGQYVPEFDEAMFNAEPGEIVGPVNTDFGSHVIRLDEITQPTFEEVRDQIAEQLSGGSDPFGTFIQQVLMAADVTVAELYGSWNTDEGRVVPPEGPTPATTTTLPPLPGLDELPAEQVPVPAG